jgi:hypothetical protein
MRWKFVDPHDAAEAAARRELTGRIDEWWQAFRSRMSDLEALFHRRKQWDLPKWMQRSLGAVHPKLMWEFGAAEHGHYLVVTPEAERSLRPLVEVMLERAPRLKGWTFRAYRQPEPIDVVAQTIEARAGAALCPLRAQARLDEQGLIDLSYRLPTEAEDEQQALHVAFVASEGLLGEEVLDKWIGSMETVDDEGEGRWLPLERLRPTVESLIDSVRDQLPDRPFFQLDEEPSGALLELKPTRAKDYLFRYDLITAATQLLPMWQSAHSGRPFYSERFSRCGERFCYLKLEGLGGARKSAVDDRAALEEDVDAALREAEIGGVVGGGTGLRYGYIDLALTNVDQAAEAIRRVLRKRRVSKRTWLLFFDCEWEREWIGVWDDAPPPPMRSEEESDE